MRDRERERTVLLLQPFVVQVRPTAIIRLCVCVCDTLYGHGGLEC